MAEIEGLKVIYAPTYRIDERANEAAIAKDHPFKLSANFRPPEFMQVTFVMLHGGSEEFVIRAKTREAIDECIKVNEWWNHPRLRHITITSPDGKEEILKGRS